MFDNCPWCKQHISLSAVLMTAQDPPGFLVNFSQLLLWQSPSLEPVISHDELMRVEKKMDQEQKQQPDIAMGRGNVGRRGAGCSSKSKFSQIKYWYTKDMAIGKMECTGGVWWWEALPFHNVIIKNHITSIKPMPPTCFKIQRPYFLLVHH